MTTITVEGSHRISQAAERGILALDVAAHGPDRDEVVTRHRMLHEEVAGIARDRRRSNVAAAFEIGSPWAWTDPTGPDPQRPAPVHHVTSTITITYTDLAALAAGVSAFAARADLGVQPVHWALSDESREGLLDAARGLAVQDAVRRARSYAAAILPGVVAEPTLLSVTERQVHGGGPGVPMLARADSGVAQFSAPEIEVEAAIVATFEL
ncbi:SIMPL domain-containing protein [Microbacterium rhizophilus]|uniref:SIMPL domain-containing protein n=1 Tax=Microbacterium rhizophilus TaxID=3138934 RepID=UPI0031EA61D5